MWVWLPVMSLPSSAHRFVRLSMTCSRSATRISREVERGVNGRLEHDEWTDRMLTVRVRVQLRVPTEGEREKSNVIESWKLWPLQFIISKFEGAKHRKLGEALKTLYLIRRERRKAPSHSLPSSLSLLTLFPVKSMAHSCWQQEIFWRTVILLLLRMKVCTLEQWCSCSIMPVTKRRVYSWCRVHCQIPILILAPDKSRYSASSRGFWECFWRSCEHISTCMRGSWDHVG